MANQNEDETPDHCRDRCVVQSQFEQAVTYGQRVDKKISKLTEEIILLKHNEEGARLKIKTLQNTLQEVRQHRDNLVSEAKFRQQSLDMQ